MEVLGHPFVIDFKPGANSAFGSDYVAKAAPDGYTLLFIPGSFTTGPATQKGLPFDTLNDFTGVSALASGQILLVVNPRLSVNSLKELVDHAKSRPGKLNYASSGTGGSVNLGMELLNLVAGINMLHVPYRSVLSRFCTTSGRAEHQRQPHPAPRNVLAPD